MNHVEPERIEEYAWGLLGGREEREVEAHLSECGECARLAERLRVEARKIGEALAEPLPAGLTDRILGEANDRRRAAPAFPAVAPRRWSCSPRWPVGRGATAAAWPRAGGAAGGDAEGDDGNEDGRAI